MNPEPHAPAAPRQTTAREFLAILFRRRAVIVGLFVVTTTTVLVIAFTTPVDFVSSGRVLIKRGEKESLLSPARRVYSDWEEDMGSEVEVVKSAPVLERARVLLSEEAGPGRTPPRLSPRGVDVEVRGRTNVVLIGYVDRDPVVAKQICDALVRSYVEFRQNDFSMSYPRDFFEGEMGRVQKDLDHWVSLRRNFAQRSNVVDLAMQRNSYIGRMGMLEARRGEVEADLAEADMAWRQTRDLKDNRSFDQPSFTMIFGNEAALIELKRRVVDAEFRVATLREKMREDAPEMVAAGATLDTLRTMMQREVASRVLVAEARKEVLQARLESILREITALKIDLAAMPEKEMSMDDMDRRIEVLKERYKELSDNSDKVRINENTTPTRNVVLLSRAGNATPRNARDYVRLALAPAFSVVVGIGVAFFMDGLDMTVRTARHAEEAAELPVLASLVERRRSRREDAELDPEALAS